MQIFVIGKQSSYLKITFKVNELSNYRTENLKTEKLNWIEYFQECKNKGRIWIDDPIERMYSFIENDNNSKPFVGNL